MNVTDENIATHSVCSICHEPALICGALATGKSGQIDAGSLFGRRLGSAELKRRDIYSHMKQW